MSLMRVKVSQSLMESWKEAGVNPHAASLVFAQAHAQERVMPLLTGDPFVVMHQDEIHREVVAVSVEFSPEQLVLLTYAEAFQAGLLPTEGLVQ